MLRLKPQIRQKNNSGGIEPARGENALNYRGIRFNVSGFKGAGAETEATKWI